MANIHSHSAFERGRTDNEFSYFAEQSCYDYYKRYACSLQEFLDPTNNIFNTKTGSELIFSYKWKNTMDVGALENDYNDVLTMSEGVILKIYNMFYKLNARCHIMSLAVEPKPHIEIKMRFNTAIMKNPAKIFIQK